MKEENKDTRYLLSECDSKVQISIQGSSVYDKKSEDEEDISAVVSLDDLKEGCFVLVEFIGNK